MNTNTNQNRVVVNPEIVSGKVFEAFMQTQMGMNVDTSNFSDTEKSKLSEMLASGQF